MNERTEKKLSDLSGMNRAIGELLQQAWERGRKYGNEEKKDKEKMTNNEAINLIQEIEEDGRNVTKEHIEALNLAIKVLDRYKPLCPVDFPTEDDPYPVCSWKRPRGEWIVTQEGRWLYPVCSLCGGKQDVKSNYCPDCGADMRGGRE